MASPRSHRTNARDRFLRLAAIVLSGAVLLSACAESEFTYVQSSDRTAFFRVPRDWETFSRREILVHSGLSLSQAADAANPWLVAVDANPNPSVDRVLQLGRVPEHPVILAQAIQLTPAANDQMSLQSLRNFAYPVDDLTQEDRAELRSYEEVVLAGGYHGIRLEYDIIMKGQYRVDVDNTVMRVSQLSVLDPAQRTVYLFLLRCESHCYRDHESVIEQITQSWTVKEPGR